MPDDENPTQNPIPEENPSPTSPQEPMTDAPILPMDSEPAEVPSETPEASRESFSDESNDIPPPDSTHIEPEKAPEIPLEPTGPQANPAFNGTGPSEPEPATAQMGRNEPLGESSRTQNQSSRNPVREILAKAQLAIQNKKRKKLDSILTLFAKRTSITNDEVERFLHVSNATATRYLSQLEKEGKIKQSGKTGRSVSYLKI